MSDEDNEAPELAPSLVTLATNGYELLQSDGREWARDRVTGLLVPIQSSQFRDELTRLYFQTEETAPSPTELNKSIRVLCAKARYGGAPCVVSLRVGGSGSTIYLHLGGQEGRSVEISAEGWRLIETAPACFFRPPTMRQLPSPVRGGGLEELGDIFNLQSEQDMVLLITFMLAALRPRGPYPVLALQGPPGSAKSTATDRIKYLLDPGMPTTRPLPGDSRDAFIAASSNHVLAFDNISTITPTMSDTLCRLSTGGGFGTRQLRTDAEEAVFDVQRPIILNGIDSIVRRGDLLDRALVIELTSIPPERRRSEATLRDRFEDSRGRLLGALLDAVVIGLRNIDRITAASPPAPRLADYYYWSLACEPAYSQIGTITPALEAARAAATAGAIEVNPAVRSVLNFLDAQGAPEWTGSATALLDALPAAAGLPKVANKLSEELRRSAPILERAGWLLDHERAPTRGRERALRFRRTARQS